MTHVARIEVQPDASALATAVAGELLARMAAVQAVGEVPAIALTGGTIADAIHAELARLSTSPDLDPGQRVDWSRVDLFWGDERFVPRDSEDRNELQARRALLDLVPVDPARVHPMPATEDGTLDEAAAAYSATVREHGRGAFDVVMLGLGPDGHVASLFPGFPQLDVEDQIAVPVTDSPKPPPERVSLTYGALNRARQVWFVVSGEGKSEAVARAHAGADRHEIPATGVRGEEATIWWLDTEAAARL